MPSVVFLPSSPLLAADGMAGSVPEVEELRDVVDDAVGATLTAEVSRILVLDAGCGVEDAEALDETAGGTLRGFGLSVRAGGPRDVLGLGHTVAAHVLDRIGWTGERRYVTQLPALDAPTVALVIADGSATRTERAPGHLHADAAPFDAELAGALSNADAPTLERLDPARAERLWCHTAPTWRRAGSDLGRQDGVSAARARLHYDAAPCGVGWFVATWSWRP